MSAAGTTTATGTAGALSRVRAHRADHDRLLRVVRGAARDGDLERVLVAATLVANHAWFAATDLLADPELERLVVDTARGGGAAWVDADRDTGRVLHVLTEAYPVGGHTRLARRWIERDPRRADVAVVGQHGEVPDALRTAAGSRGGRVFDLARAHGSLTGRAHALRRLMDSADVVVLHVHPTDAVTLAAANLPGPRPPIVLENHADHVFWLGLGAADVVMDHRGIARRVTAELRGVREERLGRLPLPIDDQPAPVGRAAMREALGLREDQVAAVTVASAAKTAPLWGTGLADLHARALAHVPALVVVVVGPSAAGEWAELARRFPGRVLALGVVPDPEALYPAMDLYLDSFPITSSTSILEAAAAGLPPLSLQVHDGYGHLYHANSPGLDDSGHVTTTEAGYLAELARLAADPDLRRDRGRRARADVLAVHSGPAWAADLEALYAQARSVPAADLAEYPQRIEDAGHGARLVGFMARSLTGQDVDLPVDSYSAPVADRLDRRLQFDLQVATDADGTRLGVRVAGGWEAHPAWTSRLVALAGGHARLRVSLPFVEGDDAEGTRSVAEIEAVLAANGETAADCGDLSLESEAPRVAGITVGTPLSCEAGTLDALEALLDSPVWDVLDREAAG